MSTTFPSSSRPVWREPALVFAAVSGLAFVILGMRAMLIPMTTSSGFGLPALGPNDALWVQVYGSRTMLLGLLAIILAALGYVVPLIFMFGIGAALPFFDMGLITSQSGPGPILFRHAAFVVWLGLGAFLLWRLQRRHRQLAVVTAPREF
ncbi:MAG: DUF4267 domain-containing protein [Beijerinckiaceae bacterium]|jgi:hypothetical protein|nr:DUF4267 domain-containing protein [Beijerinckiaceae bacterium]